MLKNRLKRPPKGIRRRFERVPKMTSRRKALKIDFSSIFGGFRDPQGQEKCGPSLELSPSFGFRSILSEVTSWTRKNMDFGWILGAKLDPKIVHVGSKTER